MSRKLSTKKFSSFTFIVAPVGKSKSSIIFIAQSMPEAKFKNNYKMVAGVQYMMSSLKKFYVQRFFQYPYRHHQLFSCYVLAFHHCPTIQHDILSSQISQNWAMLLLLLLLFIKRIFKLFLKAKITRLIIYYPR